MERDKVKIRDIESNKGQLAENYNNYNSVKKGDLLLNPMDLYSGANCNISNYDGVISPAYINLRSNKDISVNFFDYIFKLQYTSLAFQSVGKGVSKYNRWTLSNETLLNYQLPIPPISEQIQIANYLDWKINEIDKYQDDALVTFTVSMKGRNNISDVLVSLSSIQNVEYVRDV